MGTAHVGAEDWVWVGVQWLRLGVEALGALIVGLDVIPAALNKASDEPKGGDSAGFVTITGGEQRNTAGGDDHRTQQNPAPADNGIGLGRKENYKMAVAQVGLMREHKQDRREEEEGQQNSRADGYGGCCHCPAASRLHLPGLQRRGPQAAAPRVHAGRRASNAVMSGSCCKVSPMSSSP